MRVLLEKIVGGGQALGTLEDGRRAFVWGGLPGETVDIRITKKKSKYVEGIIEQILIPSPSRITPNDPDSYLSTSPWQIMPFQDEQAQKSALIREAFELHHVTLPETPKVYTDDVQYGYRNKVEFSWYSDTDAISGVDTLDIAFFRRGSKGKIVVDGTSLARPSINQLAKAIRDLLRTKSISARQLKTLLIRCDQQGNCVWQLYTKDRLPDIITASEAGNLPAQGGEVIYSNPKSPASVITERLASFGNTTLTDTILGTPFRYATEGFFQVNIPVYEQALRDMREWLERLPNPHFSEETVESVYIDSSRTLDASASGTGGEKSAPKRMCGEGGAKHILDLYSGVGTIGLTIGGDNVTLVEINEHAVREMERNIAELGRKATAILAPSEQALDHITSDKTIIVDPPRAGLHPDVVNRLLEQKPPRVIYLSCNPVTQARDVQLLLDSYAIVHTQGYNFFPRTPHIEHLVVLDRQ